MNYDIIPDSELSIDTLLNTNKLIFTESEIKSFENTPWTWYNISGQSPEYIWQAIQKYNHSQKNIDLLIDLGYSAFYEVIPMDNTIKNAIKSKNNKSLPITEITINDLKMNAKVEQLDKMSKFLSMPEINSLNQESNEKKSTLDIIFEYKIRGWDIARICYDKISTLSPYNDEIHNFNISQSNIDKERFSEISSFAHNMHAVRAFLKGSYINYVESEKKSKIPSDIDVALILKSIDKSEYYTLIQDKSKVDNIEIYPLIIPSLYANAHTFFDLDVNQNSKLIYSDPTYNPNIADNKLKTIKHPEKIIRVLGNLGINKLRKLALDEKQIIDLCKSSHAHRKIYSAIRRPEMLYKNLEENHLEHLVSAPIAQSHKFNKNSPIMDIQRLLMESSITLSRMNSEINKYIINKSN